MVLGSWDSWSQCSEQGMLKLSSLLGHHSVPQDGVTQSTWVFLFDLTYVDKPGREV